MTGFLVVALVFAPPVCFGILVGYAWGRLTGSLHRLEAVERETENFVRRERLP